MTLKEFVKNNRKLIDQVIEEDVPEGWDDAPIDDDERELWVINDEYLYNMALNEGVDLDGE